MENKWQSIFDAISDNDGEIEWVRNNSEGDSPYGVAVAKVNGNPVAAAWIVDGECQYFSPDDLFDKLNEYDATIDEMEGVE